MRVLLELMGFWPGMDGDLPQTVRTYSYTRAPESTVRFQFGAYSPFPHSRRRRTTWAPKINSVFERRRQTLDSAHTQRNSKGWLPAAISTPSPTSGETEIRYRHPSVVGPGPRRTISSFAGQRRIRNTLHFSLLPPKNEVPRALGCSPNRMCCSASSPPPMDREARDVSEME